MNFFRGRRPVMFWLASLFCCVAFPCAALAILSILARVPQGLGVRDGRLAPCPSSPNCVSTQAETQQHWIAPLTPASGDENPIETVATIVAGMQRATIVEQSETYLRAEFRSRLFRFCDDVEFFYDRSAGQIHFRSASRVGHSDLGVNRRRMEEIRQRLRSATPRRTEPSHQRAASRQSREREMAVSSRF